MSQPGRLTHRRGLQIFDMRPPAVNANPRHLRLPMELLVCIINREDLLEEILSGFLELGVTGATVIRAEGMGRVLSGEVPVLAGLQSLMAQSRPDSRMIMSVIESPDILDAAIQLVRDACGDLQQPSTGILFTVPVSRVFGLAPKLDLAGGPDGPHPSGAGSG